MVKKHKSHISNRLLYTLITIGILAILGVGVYAFGAVPNPGHSLGQLQTCDSEGQTLVMQGGSWACATGGTGGSSQWLASASGIYYNLGYVGIGTNLPTSPLDIVGWMRSQGARINTLVVDNTINISQSGKLCFGNDCRSSWAGQNYGAAPDPNFVRNANAGDLGINSPVSEINVNHFVWTPVRAPMIGTSGTTELIIDSNTDYGDNVLSPIIEKQVYIPPANGAIVGIRLDGSSVDDQGICVAGFPGYFFATVYHASYYTGNNLRGLGIDGSFITDDQTTPFLFEEASASGFRIWSWLISDLPSGSFKLLNRQCDAGGCSAAGGRDDVVAYTKAAGVTYIPPGQTLVVRGQFYDNGGGMSLKCKVQVIYAPAIP